uniref:SERPIN domain-containing protein n=1 Tax=Haemonchus contortus TaxID=6289 RepID=A0A7I4YIE7_HAECO
MLYLHRTLQAAKGTSLSAYILSAVSRNVRNYFTIRETYMSNMSCQTFDSVRRSTDLPRCFQLPKLTLGLSMLQCVPSNVSLVVSPISAIFTLAMVHVGSKGTTRSELESVISKGADTEGSNSVEGYYARLFKRITNPRDGVKSRITNRFFLNERGDVEMDYEVSILSLYGAKIERMDFGRANQTAKVIDGFIAETTERKIRNMVKEGNVEGI